MLLDEVGIEYYKPYEILMALEQAQIEKTRDYWARGMKDAIRPLFQRIDITGDGVVGIDLAPQLAGQKIMYFEALLVKIRDVETAPTHHARYIPPERFIWHKFARPGSGKVSVRLEYSQIGNLLFHNGAGTDANLSYIQYPYIPTQSDPLLLATHTHQAVVDRAAYLLYRKEVGLQDHDAAGYNADLQLIDQNQKQRAEATAARQVLRQKFKKEFENEPESDMP